MVRKITDEQMRNLMGNLLFKNKRDLKRTYKNILWFIDNHKGDVTEKVLKDALNFELSSYTTTEEGEKVIFSINKDYTQNFYSAENYAAGLELLHQQLMQIASWYKALVK